MKVVVCTKQVVDTEAEKRLSAVDFRLDRTVENILNPYDEYAVEEAVRLREAHGGQVTVLCMGPEEAAETLRKALAMGADDALLVTDPVLAGSDTQATAYVLAEVLKTLSFDVALFGIMSTDVQTGQVPAAVAELLDVPLLSSLNRVVAKDGILDVRRQTDQGYIAYTCPLPAVLSVAKGINNPRYPSVKSIVMAKKKPLEIKSAADFRLDPAQVGLAGAKTRVRGTYAPPSRLPGMKVEDTGDGPRRILDFLLREKLL